MKNMKPEKKHFYDQRTISPKHICDRFTLHLNYTGTKKLKENILFWSCKTDWQTPMVSMDFKVNINV